jgi:hypothetical protein
MVRAKVTLPNGYCGAPVQTDCEFANPCLDCRFFITTRDFLDQHRRQREETHRLIADAETAGLARVAEKNTRTAAKLDTIIGALEHTAAGQIVRFQTAATRRSTGPDRRSATGLVNHQGQLVRTPMPRTGVGMGSPRALEDEKEVPVQRGQWPRCRLRRRARRR